MTSSMVAIQLRTDGAGIHLVFRLRAQLAHHDGAHLSLLIFDRLRGVDDVEAHLLRHGFVLGQDAALKNAKALFHVAADSRSMPAS